MRKGALFLTLFLIVTFVLSSCAPAATPAPAPTQPPAPTEAPKPANTEILLATTTSTRDSGLLDVLLPLFEKQTGYKVKMNAVGSGAAMKLGQDGNADVLLVHSPAAEKDFMSKGFGAERLLVMHNDFIVVGPSSDPAQIKGTPKAVDAFKKIMDAKAVFVSRADASGTNAEELTLWAALNIKKPSGDWYIETGQGMGDTLRIANEKAGYTLSDRATYLAQKATLQLDILVEGDNALLNIYHVIPVSSQKWPKINVDGAKAFEQFMVSPDTQKIIGEFGKDKYGGALFFPDAGKSDADLGLK